MVNVFYVIFSKVTRFHNFIFILFLMFFASLEVSNLAEIAYKIWNWLEAYLVVGAETVLDFRR